MKGRFIIIISITNQKGGVAKTTTTHNIGQALSDLGKEVLLIDLDPQASLSISSGIESSNINISIYDVLCEKIDINETIINTGDFDIIPATIELAHAELKLASELGRENKLKKALDNLEKKYDYILLDSPPSLSLLVVNSLTAANKVLIPCACDYLSLRGLDLLMDSIEDIKENTNANLEILSIIPTFYDSRTLHSSEVLEVLNKRYGTLVTTHLITRSTAVRDSILEANSIVKQDKNNKIAKSYIKIAEEIIHAKK